MCNCLTILGLVLDIIGVVILFKNGSPISPLLPDGGELIWDNGTPEKKKIAQKSIKLSKLALSLLIFGFLLQLVGPISKAFPAAINDKHNNSIQGTSEQRGFPKDVLAGQIPY